MLQPMIGDVMLGISLLVAIASLGAVYRLHLLRQEDLDLIRRTDEQMARVEFDLAALCRAAAGEGRRVISIQQQVEGLAERQAAIELGASNERPYTRASRLAQEGASIDDLIRTCGLTRAEAELLVMLHGTCGRG